MPTSASTLLLRRPAAFAEREKPRRSYLAQFIERSSNAGSASSSAPASPRGELLGPAAAAASADVVAAAATALAPSAGAGGTPPAAPVRAAGAGSAAVAARALGPAAAAQHLASAASDAAALAAAAKAAAPPRSGAPCGDPWAGVAGSSLPEAHKRLLMNVDVDYLHSFGYGALCMLCMSCHAAALYLQACTCAARRSMTTSTPVLSFLRSCFRPYLPAALTPWACPPPCCPPMWWQCLWSSISLSSGQYRLPAAFCLPARLPGCLPAVAVLQSDAATSALATLVSPAGF